MFTGIITHTGTVASLEHATRGARLIVSVSQQYDNLKVGSSHAINGVCLTLLADTLPLAFDLSHETLQTTNLASLQTGDIVNIEPGMKLGDSVDGHLVTGHIDAVGTLDAINRQTDYWDVDISFPASLGKYIARKGSISVDGVSLTVNALSGQRLTVTVIPHTCRCTRFSTYTINSTVNLEVDLIARYVARVLEESNGRWQETKATFVK